jgi:hypothetical protein
VEVEVYLKNSATDPSHKEEDVVEVEVDSSKTSTKASRDVVAEEEATTTSTGNAITSIETTTANPIRLAMMVMFQTHS